MKTINLLVAFLITTTIAISCKKNEPKTTSENITKPIIAADAKLASTSFKIDGMTCAVGCAKTIEKELTSSVGVKSAIVDFDKKTATVEYDSATQTPEKLVELVEKTGDGKTYKVSRLVKS